MNLITDNTAMTEAAFNKKKTIFNINLDVNVRKKLVNWYIRIISFYGAESWTLRRVDQKYLKGFEVWCWRKMEKINWTDRVRNEVLQRVKEERNNLHTIKRERLTGLVTACVGTAL